MRMTMAMPMALGLGPLNSKASTVLSGMIHLSIEFAYVLQ
jgi:hypothetical protein